MPRTPQFASTPRFLLSQRGPPSSAFATRPPAEAIDEDDSPQNTPLAKRVRGRPLATTASAARPINTQRSTATRDVIEDSEDDESVLSQNSEMEAEYEALFGEKEGSAVKRRRVRDEDEEDGMNEDRNDMDQNYPEPDDNSQADHQDDQYTHAWDDNEHATPQQEPNHNDDAESYSDENIPSSSLESPSKTQLPNPTPNLNRPRFLLSASQLHTPSHPHSHPHPYPHPPSSTKAQTHTTPSQSMTPAPARIAIDPEPTPAPGPGTALPPSSVPPPSTRRKPTFVLPRSPSPDEAADAFLSLFSPSKTRRRGGRGRVRTSGQGQGYVAGGMAEQVRGWVLEVGAKGNTRSGQEQQYAFVVRVEEATRSSMGSCGELTFVRGVVVEGQDHDQGQDEGDGMVRNVLLMGAPLSRRMNFQEGEMNKALELQKGDRVGVGQGLVWDVELESVQDGAEMEKWEVCLEWDVM